MADSMNQGSIKQNSGIHVPRCSFRFLKCWLISSKESAGLDDPSVIERANEF